MKTIRNIAAGTILSLGLVAGAAGTASADAPYDFTESVTFPEINPCTGDEMLVTIDLAVRESFHRNNLVVHLDRSGTTSDGYEMHGVERAQANDNVLSAGFTDIWHDDSGSSFKVQGMFLAKRKGGVQFDRFRMDCLAP